MSPISVLSANLATGLIESFFYGVYALLALFAVYLMVIRHNERARGTVAVSRSKLVSPVALGTFGLFGMITAHWVLNIVRLFFAFHEWDDGPGPRIFYSDMSHTTEMLKYGLLVASMFVGDLFIIHRLWLVWARYTPIVIFPTVVVLTLLSFGIGLTYQLTTYGSTDSIYESRFRLWTTGVCFSSMCVIVYTTGFVWYKLWSTSRMLTSVGMASLSTITRIFIDGAALLAVWGGFHIVSYQAGSNLQFIAIDCMPVMVGIANLLIQIRLHWNTTEKQESLVSTHPITFAARPRETQRDMEGDMEVATKATFELPPL
ncbi:hypothetical protein C8R43DRAFT_1039466 [Mycena crocata]|nr:hypothetical protein C8R43DRAFT_1039466 [Mycena crocata]